MTACRDQHADIWRNLEQVMDERIRLRPSDSYVTELVAGGHAAIAGKVVEEAYELIEACGAEERTAVIHEAADLMFHILVLLRTNDVRFDDVEEELARRFGVGGLREKKTRAERPS
jgi:phosphoribosyl-ATP pyrophosphohydrolase